MFAPQFLEEFKPQIKEAWLSRGERAAGFGLEREGPRRKSGTLARQCKEQRSLKAGTSYQEGSFSRVHPEVGETASPTGERLWLALIEPCKWLAAEVMKLLKIWANRAAGFGSRKPSGAVCSAPVFLLEAGDQPEETQCNADTMQCLPSMVELGVAVKAFLLIA